MDRDAEGKRLFYRQPDLAGFHAQSRPVPVLAQEAEIKKIC
jgi:hypothetical protein